MAATDPASSLKSAREAVERIIKSLSQDPLDRIVDRVALETEASLKINTPKRFFGQVRAGWTTRKPEPGARIISNAVQASNGTAIILLLEDGTANGGTGWITPKRAKKLYIPLTSRAAAGWRPGLKYGKDYILKTRVHGIKPRHIIANEQPKIQERLATETKKMVTGILRAEGFVQ